jgi:hypothetical protein
MLLLYGKLGLETLDKLVWFVSYRETTIKAISPKSIHPSIRSALYVYCKYDSHHHLKMGISFTWIVYNAGIVI